MAWRHLILAAFIVEPTSLPAITIGGASKLHVDVMGILTAMTATMKKTASLQVLQLLPTPLDFSVSPISSFVMVVDVWTRLENVMESVIVQMELMNMAARQKKFLLPVVPVTLFVMAGAVFLCLESVTAIVIVLMAVMNKTVQNRKAMEDLTVALTSLSAMVVGVLIRLGSVMAVLTVLMDLMKGTAQVK